jgi:hypothetical protein
MFFGTKLEKILHSAIFFRQNIFSDVKFSVFLERKSVKSLPNQSSYELFTV